MYRHTGGIWCGAQVPPPPPQVLVKVSDGGAGGGGGYYIVPFHGERVITQGNPMYPIIINVVVDAVVCHWYSMVAGEMGGGGSRDDDEAG